MARFDAHSTHHGFACCQARLGGLDTVVDRVPQQVIQRRFEALEHVPVDFGGLAMKLELHLTIELTRDVAHHARQAVYAVAERRMRLFSASRYSRSLRSSTRCA